jgi:hypothetical protein
VKILFKRKINLEDPTRGMKSISTVMVLVKIGKKSQVVVDLFEILIVVRLKYGAYT